MTMGSFYLFLLVVLFVGCIILTAMEAWNQSLGSAIAYGVGAAVLSIFLLGGTAYVFGFGHVAQKPESLDKRLKTGVAYQLVSSVRDGDDRVILVKKAGKSDFFALRVKETPPELFTLLDGKPVAIVAPAPPVGVK